MHYVEAKTVLTPQNGYSPYHGSTEKNIYCEGLRKPYSSSEEDYHDVEVKKNAPELLAKALSKKRIRGMVMVGSIVDPYMNIEKEEKIMRESLITIRRFDFGASITTRNCLLLRDIDICRDINKNAKLVVNVPVETVRDDISCKLCEGASPVSERFEMIKTLTDNGIPVVAVIGPLVPYINDAPEDIEALLEKLSEYDISGIDTGNMLLTLRAGVGKNFHETYKKLFPDEYEKYKAEFGRSEVVSADRNGSISDKISEYASGRGLLFGKNEIDRFNRSYENKTEGKQLSLFELL
ncbi:MAG: hypothetical protein K6C35_01195 [Eubacterium sp.]|nr:hypothetical protein [Eubacterium sp.]